LVLLEKNMIRGLCLAMLACSALGMPQAPTDPAVEFLEMAGNLMPRQESGSDRPWLRQNSLTEAMSVLFPDVSTRSLPCQATNADKYRQGSCTRVTDCMLYGGTNVGSCGAGFGSCCVFEKHCGESTNLFTSHFVSPLFSTVDNGRGECKLTVVPNNPSICQFRLDFDAFEILGPDSTSNCVDDFFGVTGGSSVPKLCGDLTKQHVYVNVKPAGGPIVLTVDTSKMKTMARKWNIKITQISCSSPERAPAGCLQFFNETSGTITSFNYRSQMFTDSNDVATRQIRKLNYGICISSKVGYCDVTWTQSTSSDRSFSVSGDSLSSVNKTAIIPAVTGTEDCPADYILISGGTYRDPTTKNKISASKYCGNSLPEVKTAFQPYVLHVHTQEDEEGDSGNIGFELNFRQNLCHT